MQKLFKEMDKTLPSEASSRIIVNKIYDKNLNFLNILIGIIFINDIYLWNFINNDIKKYITLY